MILMTPIFGRAGVAAAPNHRSRSFSRSCGSVLPTSFTYFVYIYVYIYIYYERETYI